MGAKAAPIPLALGTKEKIEVSYAPTFRKKKKKQKGKKEASPRRWRTRQHPLGGGRGCAVIEELFLPCTIWCHQIYLLSLHRT